jgi:heme/copper-type cytochrome/quinol oxidase subunit 3
MGPRATIDVSHLPDSAWDERSPLWWGNLLLALIESSTVLLMLATYFYLRMNERLWPPPKVDVFPPILDPNPDLGVATANVLMLIGSCALMYWTDMAARRKDKPKVVLGLVIMLVVSIVAMVLRWYEFKATKFWWNDNAYASALWWTLGLHFTYLLAGAGEFFIMGVWIATHKLDEKHALDVTLAGGYWYWVAGTATLIYAVIFIGPRIL